ncbi:MAG: peptidoglycan-binding protein, partial [Comamonadaceae bacterium]
RHAALRRVHAVARGVPRRINLLCDRALLGAYAGGRATVGKAIVDRAAAEVFPRGAQPKPAWRRPALAGVFGVAAGAGLLAAATQGVPAAWNPMGPTQAEAKVAVPVSAVAQARPAVASASAAVPVAAQVPDLAAANVANVAKVAEPAATLVTASAAAAPVLLQDEAAAWRELAQAWKLDVPPGEPCAVLEKAQVFCFSRTMSLAMIRQLARPGIITLDAGSARPSFAILTAVTDRAATLRAAGTEQTVTLAALAQRWHGDFATLWRAPDGYRGERAGDFSDAPSIHWVATRLATLKGAPPPAKAPVLDTALKSEVRSFQLAQGIPADGRPGPLTYMQLNRASGVDEPRLRTQP